MSLTPQDVKNIANLARLEISDAEVEKFLPQLEQILDNAKMLDEVNTEEVEPIFQITGLKTVVFKDEVCAFEHPEKLLAESPMEIQNNMIKVKNIL